MENGPPRHENPTKGTAFCPIRCTKRITNTNQPGRSIIPSHSLPRRRRRRRHRHRHHHLMFHLR